MNNRELIYKYYSGLLSKSERIRFEKKLNTDEELRSELNNFREKVENFSALKEVEIDERYFSSILPRVREKIDRKKNVSVSKIAYSLSFAATVLIVFLLSTQQPRPFDTKSYLVNETIIEESSESEIISRLYSDLIYNPEYLDLSINNDANGNSIEQINMLDDNVEFELPIVDDIFVNDLDESEQLKIYNEFKNKKFLEK